MLLLTLVLCWLRRPAAALLCCPAVIRYCRTDSADIVLMAGLPLPAPSTSLNQLDGLLMVKLPFKDDLRQFTFRTFNDPSKTHVRGQHRHRDTHTRGLRAVSQCWALQLDLTTKLRWHCSSR